jgi:hypothetical protein
MDEALDAAEVIADSEFEGAVVAPLRVVGALMLLAGFGLWLLTAADLRWLPVVLTLGGTILVTIPGIAFELLG